MSSTLIVAIVAACLSAASLSWQAATYLLNGGRPRAELLIGAINPDSGDVLRTNPHAQATPGEWKLAAEQGFTVPVLGIRVVNHGRGPVTIEKWEFSVAGGPSVTVLRGAIGPELAHELAGGRSATWYAPAQEVHASAMVTKEVVGQKTVQVVGVVTMATGRSRRTKPITF